MNLNELIDDPNIDGLDPEDTTACALLEKTQGNILKHHGRGHGLHVLLRFKPEPEQLKAALNWFGLRSAPTSALEQIAHEDDPDFLYRAVALSKSGYAALCIPEECQPADPVFQSGSGYGRDDPMAGWGYAARPPGFDDHLSQDPDGLIILAHNDPQKLETAWREVCEEIAPFADVALDSGLKTGLPEPGHFLWMGEETGDAMECGVKPAGESSWYVECFGYADGISLPRFLKQDVEDERQRKGAHAGAGGNGPWGRGTPLNRVLGEDGSGGYGSYLAFHKYEQDVEGFHRSVESLRDRMVTDVLAEKLVSDPSGFLDEEGIEAPFEDENGKRFLSFCSDTLKCGDARREACGDPQCNDGRTCMDHLSLLKGRPDFVEAMRGTRQFQQTRPTIDLDRVYAMVVGRYRDGRPLIDPEAGRQADDFDFASDPDGQICPFHAHVRRMNPRGQRVRLPSETEEPNAAEASEFDEWRHLIARRGMPYQHGYSDDSVRSGLYFISFQSALAEFERLLADADDDGYVQTGYDERKWAAAPVGIDPIIGGHPAPANQSWPRPDTGAATQYRLTHYVALRGGGYFYAPSIQFIENIEEISTLTGAASKG